MNETDRIVRTTFGDDGVASLTLASANPTATVAAGMLREIIADADRLATSFPQTRTVVVSADATDRTGRCERGAPRLHVGSSLLRQAGEACAALRAVPQPVIAKVSGRWDGVVAWLALACDLAVLDSSAKFTRLLGGRERTTAVEDPYVLTHILGRDKVNQLAVLSEDLSGAQALGAGIVNRVVRSEDLDDFVRRWAAELTGAEPFALAESKRALNAAFEKQSIII